MLEEAISKVHRCEDCFARCRRVPSRNRSLPESIVGTGLGGRAGKLTNRSCAPASSSRARLSNCRMRPAHHAECKARRGGCKPNSAVDK